jgi:hypothetical protein
MMFLKKSIDLTIVRMKWEKLIGYKDEVWKQQ